MTTVTVVFLIGIGVYLLGLAIFCIIKRIRNKKHFQKEMEEKSDEPTEINTSEK